MLGRLVDQRLVQRCATMGEPLDAALQRDRELVDKLDRAITRALT